MHSENLVPKMGSLEHAPDAAPNRAQRRAAQAKKGKKVPKSNGARLVLATNVLVQQRALLARLLSAAIVKLGGEIVLTDDDVNAACNLGFVAEAGPDGAPVLRIANGDKGAPLALPLADVVRVLAIGGST